MLNLRYVNQPSQREHSFAVIDQNKNIKPKAISMLLHIYAETEIRRVAKHHSHGLISNASILKHSQITGDEPLRFSITGFFPDLLLGWLNLMNIPIALELHSGRQALGPRRTKGITHQQGISPSCNHRWNAGKGTTRSYGRTEYVNHSRLFLSPTRHVANL